MKEEKRRAKKPIMAKIFFAFHRKFPEETEAVTRKLDVEDASAMELIAAASDGGVPGL